MKHFFSIRAFTLILLASLGCGSLQKAWAACDEGSASCSGSNIDVDLSPQFPTENKEQIGGTCYANAAMGLVEASFYRQSKDCNNRKQILPEFCACQYKALCELKRIQTNSPNSSCDPPGMPPTKGSVDNGDMADF